ncbi:MAG: excinuclease ABC subunit UvrA, partial [Armatimonadetes bacterium]|nr:excinuclease ABC subunit UvrA [Armatimonadota bacterium]
KITGISGSGKSSLAFDTLYAEGQRRYVESLSAYARQFLGQMDKPDVDHIEGLSPAVSIDQKSTSRNPRSTVGTVTEIYDYLRLLYARIGRPHCAQCGREIAQQTVEQIVDRVMSLPEGTRIQLLAPVVKGRKGEYRKELEQILQEGYTRVRVDGQVYDLGADKAPDLDRYKQHWIDIVVDRLVVRADIGGRLSDSLETALKKGEGVVAVSIVPARQEPHAPLEPTGVVTDDGPPLPPPLAGGGQAEGAASPAEQEMLFSEHFACSACGISMEEIAPRTFSFNSPYGACPECHGLGTRTEFDPDKIVPDKSLSLRGGALVALMPKTPGANYGNYLLGLFGGVAEQFGFDLDTPISELTQQQMSALMYGVEGNVTVRFRNRWGRVRTFDSSYAGAANMLERRGKDTTSEWIKEELNRFRSTRPCPVCNGARLKPEALAVTINGWNIAQLTALSIAAARDRFGALELTPREETIARQIVKEIRTRLTFLVNVGLDYLTLDRGAVSLAGGEAQRIRLATQIGSGLMGVLYILDEPSIGLHQRDNAKLIGTLLRLRDLGNTIIVVEHDEETMRAADHIVDIGPGAGEHGGRVIAQGTLADIMATEGSITGRFLSGARRISMPLTRRPVPPLSDRSDPSSPSNQGWLEIRGASAHNLKNITVRIPLGVFVCVTGVSGSGKSTLVQETLLPRLMSKLHGSLTTWAPHEDIVGIEQIDKVIDIDQSPIGRTPRSNPATYTGTFDMIRDLFAATPEARVRGYMPGRFSFNVKGGRCEACKGDGIIKIEMHFLPDVYVPCEVCKGKRYNRETLEVHYKGKTIAGVLEMTVSEAVAFFSAVPRICRKLSTLHDVGLDYIRLGQPATTLSGGEAQRIKLASELSKSGPGSTLYILDEPTTGLHMADIEKLLEVLGRLVDAGNTILVIEHNLDVIKTADYIIDLGPEGGDGGGHVVATGSPEDVAETPTSYTGQFLKKVLAAA